METTELSDAAPAILLISSTDMWRSPRSPLLRFAREYRDVLRNFVLYATERTGKALLETGLYRACDKGTVGSVCLKKTGSLGGIVEIAELAAKGRTEHVICLIDSTDPWVDAADFRALKRLCIQRELNLITTVAGAEHFLTSRREEPWTPDWTWHPPNWIEGIANRHDGEFIARPRSEQTLALIAHDGKKRELVQFVLDHASFVSEFHRILTTGTTGLTLELALTPGSGERRRIREQAKARELHPERQARMDDYADAVEAMWEPGSTLEFQHPADRDARVAGIIEELEQLDKAPWKANGGVPGGVAASICEKLYRLPSGPDGGDILIAAEVLRNQCHAIVFLQDPKKAHPHSPDIRLLEKTCTIKTVRAVCVGSRAAANYWVARESSTSRVNRRPEPLAREMRMTFPELEDVVLVPTEDLLEAASAAGTTSAPNRDDPAMTEMADAAQKVLKDGACELIGSALARAAAGYFHRALIHTLESTAEPVGVAISWGQLTSHIAEELDKLTKCEPSPRNDKPLLSIAPLQRRRLRWHSMIGLVQSRGPVWEANAAASAFRHAYRGAGVVRHIGLAAFGQLENRHEVEEALHAIEGRAKCTRFVITSLGPPSMSRWLHTHTKFDEEIFPREYSSMMTGIFLDEQGEPMELDRGHVVIGYSGAQLRSIRQRESAPRGVILVASGSERYDAIRSTIKGGFVNVLVTTEATARAVVALELSSREVAPHSGRTAKSPGPVASS